MYEDEITHNKYHLWWNFTGALEPNEDIFIEFDSKMTSHDEAYLVLNTVWATGYYGMTDASDSSEVELWYAMGCEPAIDVEKQTWSDGAWHDEPVNFSSQDTVRFNITVRNTGSCLLHDWFFDDWLEEGMSFNEGSCTFTVIYDTGEVWRFTGDEAQPNDIYNEEDGGYYYTVLEWWETDSEPFYFYPGTIFYIELNATVDDDVSCDMYENWACAHGYNQTDVKVEDEDWVNYWINCDAPAAQPPVVDITYPEDGDWFNYTQAGMITLTGIAYDQDTYVDRVDVMLYYEDNGTFFYYTNSGWSLDPFFYTRDGLGAGTSTDPLVWQLPIEPGFPIPYYQYYVYARAYDHDTIPLMGSDTNWFWFPEAPPTYYSLSGTIYYTEDVYDGELRVVLFDEKPITPDISPIDTISMFPTHEFPIEYTFSDLAPGTYYVAAQIDFDYSGGPPDEGELDGYAINQTSINDIDAITIVNANANDVDITLFQINSPPNAPINQEPSDGLTDASINMNLYWTGGDDPDVGDTITFDVYFGTTNPPSYIATSTSPYTLPTMSYDTQYFWYIVAIDNHGASTPGPIWNFTTENEVIPTTTVGCSIDTQPIYVGDSFVVTVYIDPAEEVGGWEFYIEFTPTLANATQVEKGVEWMAGFFDKGTIDNELGKINSIQAALTFDDISEYPSTNNTACTISFTALQPGTFTIDFDTIQSTMSDPFVEYLSVSYTSLTIDILDLP
jgi:uncharacterized repeat protein (TIGR01451 family)